MVGHDAGRSLRMREARRHEVKFTKLNLKRVDTDGTFEGYASLFNKEDLAGDVVMPGAFADSIARRGSTGIKLLFQHDANQPIGVWTQLAEDARGARPADARDGESARGACADAGRRARRIVDRLSRAHS
jgi:phage head maturation protease